MAGKKVTTTDVVLMRLMRIQSVCKRLQSDILISDTDSLARKVFIQVSKADDACLRIVKMFGDKKN
jgi:hypothetical protein